MRRRTKILAGGIALALLALAVWLAVWPAKPVFQAGLVRFVSYPDDQSARGGSWEVTVAITNTSSQTVMFPDSPGRARSSAAVHWYDTHVELESQTGVTNTSERPIWKRWTPDFIGYSPGDGVRKDSNSDKFAWLPNTAFNDYILSSSWEGHPCRVRFQVMLNRDAGGLRRALSRVICRLPVKSLPQSVWSWLKRNGMQDGQMTITSVTPWLNLPTNTPPELPP